MNRQDIDDYYNPLDQLLFNFLPIENVILVLFACIGFILFSTFNNKSSSFEVGLLRAKGFSKKDLIKISFYESVILSLLGLVFCLLLFVAQPVMLMFLNRIRTGGFDQDFYLYYKPNPWKSIGSILLGGLFFLWIEYYYLVQQVKQTDIKKELERILRGQ
jgi:ABC-type antimicrobial peptide transport system permease subunit